MAHIVEHLPVEDLERRYREAEDVTEARHLQAIWLLAQGRTALDVAGVLAFTPHWVEQLAARSTRTARMRWVTSTGTGEPVPCGATGVPRAC